MYIQCKWLHKDKYIEDDIYSVISICISLNSCSLDLNSSVKMLGTDNTELKTCNKHLKLRQKIEYDDHMIYWTQMHWSLLQDI